VNECLFYIGSHHTVSSTVGADTSTIDPRWRVGFIEVGEGREDGWESKRNAKDEVTSNRSH
jgi:hypothetical protein